MRTLLFLIKKNIMYHPVSNGALIFCYAIIAASLFSGNYIMNGASESVQAGISRLGADLVVVPSDYTDQGEAVLLRGEPTTFFFDRNVLPDIENISGVLKVAPQLYIATLNSACCYLPVQLITFDSERDFTIIPWLRESDHPLLKKDEIIEGNLIVPDIGTSLKFYGHEFIITGKLEPTGTGLDTSIFIRAEDARVMAAESKEKAFAQIIFPASGVSAVLVKVNNVSEIDRISSQITTLVPKTKVLTPKTLITTVSGQLNTLTQILAMITLIATLVSLPLIALISVMVANERIRDVGILRALGASRRVIFRLIFGESIIIAIFGAIVGIIVSWTILVLFQELFVKITGAPPDYSGYRSHDPDNLFCSDSDYTCRRACFFVSCMEECGYGTI